MPNRERYLANWLRYHLKYEKRVKPLLSASFRKMVKDIPFNKLTEQNYKEVITKYIQSNSNLKDTFFNIYSEVGFEHGKIVGAGINKDLKFFTLGNFKTAFDILLAIWMRDYGLFRVVTIQETLIENLVDIIAIGMEASQPLDEIVDNMQEKINRPNFYRWQIERIARTETTAAANFGALVGGEISGFAMDKEWISATDERTRISHAHMDGVRVDLNGFFDVEVWKGKELLGTEPMSFPGSPSASAGNVINCRCTVAVIPKRDAEGNLIFKEDEVLPFEIIKPSK